MSDQKDGKQFADINDKLNAPKKISVFERQRQEAESKRLREEAETRKALRDFEDSFADEDEDDDDLMRMASGRGFPGSISSGSRPGPPSSLSGGPGGPRHFTSSERPRNVGPGSLGPAPDLKRKRGFEDRQSQRGPGTRNEARPPAFGGDGSERDHIRRGLGSLEDDDENNLVRGQSPEPAVKKPTMLLQSLPPSISKGAIGEVVASSLKVEDVSILRPTTNESRNSRTLSALVTVTADTPISEVDSTVSALQGQYLGFGCYLKISRHVSSSGGLASVTSQMPGITDTQPFGAKQAIVHPTASSLRNAPPPNSYGNYPPPNAYVPSGPGHSQRMPGLMQVAVTPPNDIKQMKLIHKTAESLLVYGSEFEALLMSRPQIQRDEKWAWLFDATSQGGVYYRWLVWKLCSEDEDNHSDSVITPESQPSIDKIFDSGPIWQTPIEKPRYEHITNFEEFVEDDEYVSSEDESGDEGERKQYNSGHGSVPVDDVDSGTRARYLNPYRRAKLTHLLARLPENIATLRMGDVARVTNFVVNNAGQGAEEIVDILLTNVDHPYRFAVTYNDHPDSEDDITGPVNTDADNKKDTSPSKLIGLYLISDAVQASSTSGVRDAWKYRSLFEVALTSRRTFEHLGRLEKEHFWGRMKAEQWKRKIGTILTLWGTRSVFPGEAHEGFKKSFFDPPLTELELKVKIEEDRREERDAEARRWRSAEDAARERKEDEERVEREKRDAARAKIEEIKARAKVQAEQLAQAKLMKQEVPSQQTSPVVKTESPAGSARRNRPTAADLNDDPPERIPALAAHANPAPINGAAPSMKIGFSLSLGGAGGGDGGNAAANVPALVPNVPDARAQTKTAEHSGVPNKDMFGDSDEE